MYIILFFRLWYLNHTIIDSKYIIYDENQNTNNDIYCVRFNPINNNIAYGGYQKRASLIDIETNQIIKTFSDHNSAITHLSFSPYGNILVTSSKDCKIRFWDILSGVSIMTLPDQLSEVTSVEYNYDGTKLLSASKDISFFIYIIKFLNNLIIK